MSTLDKMELKVPPVVVGLIVAILMWFSAQALPRFASVRLHQPRIAIGFVVVGLLIAIFGVVSFRRARTTVDPRYPQNVSALVTSGIYRATRNPMYLGMLWALAGWAFSLGHLFPFFFLPLFIAILNRLQIIPEERVLQGRFGPAFASYCTQARRWI